MFSLQNFLMLCGIVCMWTMILQLVVPTQMGRTILGIFGSVIICFVLKVLGYPVFNFGV